MNREPFSRTPLTAACWLACAVAVLGSAQAQEPAALHEVVLHNFPPNAPQGANPYATLVADAAGNLYGTSLNGGTSGRGVVFKVDSSGKQTVMYNFTGGADGGFPQSGVIRDAAGNLYGTTTGGGNLTGPVDFGCFEGCGVVYKLDPSGNETVLYAFTGGADGSAPQAGVILDAAGNLYGTAADGAQTFCGNGCGVVFEIDSSGTFKVLYTFTGGADGGNPESGVIRDVAGNLYGTTFQGGNGCAIGCGVVYKLDPSGNEHVLYSFTNGADGGLPNTGVIRDSAGNLYGTTTQGGASFEGVVYKLDPAGNETPRYTFTGGADGGGPWGSGVIRDAAGNLYGATEYGGLGGVGVVYKLDPAGNETVLYNFTGGADGGYPQAGVFRDTRGNIYGTTVNGGATNQGVVYKLDTTSHETILCGFASPADGASPVGSLFRDAAGNLYGTNDPGGQFDQGDVFKVDPSRNETVLYTFTGGSDGSGPSSGVIGDADGNLYGTAISGGLGSGVVFKIDPAGNESVLFNFPSEYPWAGGYLPFNFGGLIRDEAGNFYGTTLLGGLPFGCCGVVFKLDPLGNETVLYSFSGPDGQGPESGVIRDPQGNFYGTTDGGGATGQGVLYRLDPVGHLAVLHDFTGGADGGIPFLGVIRDTAGNLYGTTPNGGDLSVCGGQGCGVIYELDSSNNFKVLYTFSGGADGAGPNKLVRDAAGTLWGTSDSGGKFNFGTAFRLDAAGNFTVLHTFSGGTDGGSPGAGGLIRDADGNFYGTTSRGGQKLGGVVFELKPQ